MDEDAEMLSFSAGTGEIHNFVRKKGPVQRRERERKQCAGEDLKWSKCASIETNSSDLKAPLTDGPAVACGCTGSAMFQKAGLRLGLQTHKVLMRLRCTKLGL